MGGMKNGKKDKGMRDEMVFVASCYALQGLLARENEHYNGMEGYAGRAVALGEALVSAYDGSSDDASEDF